MKIILEFISKKEHDDYCVSVTKLVKTGPIISETPITGTSIVVENDPFAVEIPAIEVVENDPLSIEVSGETTTADTAVTKADIADKVKAIIVKLNVKGKEGVRAILDEFGVAGLNSLPAEKREAFMVKLVELYGV